MLISSISFLAAGEPPAPAKVDESPRDFRAFATGGLETLRSDARFRWFLYSQWLGGATLMALPFYVVMASNAGLGAPDVGILLGAQTVGALASNALWGQIGDRFGKLALLQAVGALRLAPPIGALFVAVGQGSLTSGMLLLAFALLFVAVGALVNGMTIGYLGYLMEISPDDRRPAYSAYFNALAAPAALLPLAGAAMADVWSLEVVFGLAVLAAAGQLFLYARLGRYESGRCGTGCGVA